jgi:competence ComEA-like helix-hairpin-helix protein
VNPSLPIEPTPSPDANHSAGDDHPPADTASPIETRFPGQPIERPDVFATLLWLTLAINLATLPWLLITISPPADSPTGKAFQFTTDINNAPASELSLLPGIGKELANRIVIDRATHGPFRSADDLTRVPGVGPKKIIEAAPLINCGPAQNQPAP